jgi:hypothetical protein
MQLLSLVGVGQQRYELHQNTLGFLLVTREELGELFKVSSLP